MKINKPLKEQNMLSTGPDSVVYTVGLLLKKSRIRHQTRSHLREDTNDVRKAKKFLEGSPRTLREDKGRSSSCRQVKDHTINGIFFVTFVTIRILLQLIIGACPGPTGGGIGRGKSLMGVGGRMQELD
jgi:hypothetical protein